LPSTVSDLKELPMNPTRAHLQQQLDPARVIQLTYDLVSIPSPTGDSRRAAEFYAERLRALGLDVEFGEEYPRSPSVVAYVEGAHPGPTLELSGHLDVIPVPHDPPEIREGVLYGRGTSDMKGGMAAVLEVTRVLAAVREQLHGRLMVCAYGLHEAPVGRGQVLSGLLERGIVGDAAISVEGPLDEVPVIGKGMSTYEIVVERPGVPIHEVHAPPDLPHPLLIGLEVAQALRAWNEELSRGEDLPYVGPETVFIGQFESGDFYNRVPNRCRIVGTRRYAPDVRFPQVEAEFQAHLDPIRARLKNSRVGTPADVRLDLVKTKDGFRVSEEEPIVQMLQQGYQEVTGRALPASGFKAVGDVSNFVNEGGVPAVYYGCGLERSHATPEYVPLERLERLARVLLATSALYLGVGGS
jgi:acetylornithine deacetylase/succinyl-diaminopimelate desuccinylase-like protein